MIYFMRYFWYTLLATTLLALGSCESRKTIPDDELADIFHDAVLVNAYIGNQHFRLDSMNIYEPIFEKYGYTTEDVRYTISSFLRRKSANLSDVVDDMIKSIEQEYDLLKIEVAKLDTIDDVAKRVGYRRIMNDTTHIEIKSKRDTAKLRHKIEFQGAGEYSLGATFSIDKNDKSRGRRMTLRKMLRDSSMQTVYSTSMSYREDGFATGKVTISERDAENIIGMELYFDDFSQVSKKMSKEYPRPKVSKMTIKSIVVDYTPTLEKCIEDLYEQQLGIRIFADTLIRSIEKQDIPESKESNDIKE